MVDKLTKQVDRLGKRIDKRSKKYRDKTQILQQAKAKSKTLGDDLWLSFHLLATNFCRYVLARKFQGIEVEDAIQETTLTCWAATTKFDPTKGKAFNYFTTMIYNKLQIINRGNSKDQEKLANFYAEFLISSSAWNGEKQPSIRSNLYSH